ncbi:MAG TPA: trypsin-like peptidase domain-containing protein, partial [Planctomycetota bacterium]|nr:trypsin-like peptidase domain-containing protein [Planctomycetota bacterium]
RSPGAWVVILILVALAALGSAYQPLTPVGASSPAEGDSELTDFRAVVKRAKDAVFPSLVFIKVIQESHDSGKRSSRDVSGSGVIVSAAGEILTNWHVIEKASRVRCLLQDGRAFAAQIVGSDKDLDLALLRLELPSDAAPIPFATIGDSDHLEEGEFVMAMGAPWGLARSVSIGIVSCTRRFLPEASEYALWLQTDTSISPGNSGGPLVDTAGHVVGLNTRGVLYGGDMGFALPSSVMLEVLPRLREHGSAHWSWTGIHLQPLRDFARDMYFDADEGVIVASTDPESPGRRAGLLTRDRIVRIKGEPVTAVSDEDLPAIRRKLALLPRGEPVSIDVVRAGETLSLELVPREKGRVEGEALDCPRWDLTLKAINRFENPELHFYRAEGVFVYGVRSPGNASSAGLETQDILIAIDGEEVRTLDDVRAIHARSLENIRRQRRVLLTILRGGQRRQLVLDISRDWERK